MISAGKIDGFWLGFLFSKEKFIYLGRAVGGSERGGGEGGGHKLTPLIEMGLTDLPKYGPLPVPTALLGTYTHTTRFINFLENQGIEGAHGNAMDMK